MIVLVGILFALALGGVAFAFTGGDEKTQKRVAAVAKPAGNARGRAATTPQDAAMKRKNGAVLLKDVEKNRAAKKDRPTMRRRLEQAGFPKAAPRTFWMICGIAAACAAGITILMHQHPLVVAAAVFVVGLGLPRWVRVFLTARRN
jgi:tight adherence protein B